MNSTILGKVFFALGFYVFLLTGILHSKHVLTTKVKAYQIIEQRLIREGGTLPVDIESIYRERRGVILKNAATMSSLGLICCIVGTLLMGRDIKDLKIASSKQLWLQAAYWLLFCGVALYITTEGYKNFITCDYTWLFIFLTAGIFGFYMGYLYLADRYTSILKPKAFLNTMLIAGIGGILSYGAIIVKSALLLGSPRSLFDLSLILPVGFFACITLLNILIGMMAKRLGNKIMIAKI